MTRAHKFYDCTKCGGVIPRGTNYLNWRGGKYHIDCAPKKALKDMRVNAHYPTSRRIMKKVLHTGSVRGFFK